LEGASRGLGVSALGQRVLIPLDPDLIGWNRDQRLRTGGLKTTTEQAKLRNWSNEYDKLKLRFSGLTIASLMCL
jgi:hypothetical protein